jgi:ubiquinone/menaquinone biosynthesis C-methylase UbiE
VTDHIDRSKADIFAERLFQIINDGMLCLLISVGHRTRLFDTMATLPPSTSQEVATAAGLNERYVREWLGGMLAGSLLEYDRDSMRFALPQEHAAFLTRTSGADNMASLTRYVAMLGDVEDEIVECFSRGGGVPYSRYAKVVEVDRENISDAADATLIDVTLPLVPGLVERLQGGIDVADVGCGIGHAINVMARAFPASRFTGYDISQQSLAYGRAEAEAIGLRNARFEDRDAATLDGIPSFDFITTFDSIHDQADPAAVLRGIALSLNPGGAYLCVDIAASSDVADNATHPAGPLLYTYSTMHCMPVSLALNGAGLGSVWGEQLALRMLAEAGFSDVDSRRVDGDIINNYYICKTG